MLLIKHLSVAIDFYSKEKIPWLPWNIWL